MDFELKADSSSVRRPIYETSLPCKSTSQKNTTAAQHSYYVTKASQSYHENYFWIFSDDKLCSSHNSSFHHSYALSQYHLAQPQTAICVYSLYIIVFSCFSDISYTRQTVAQVRYIHCLLLIRHTSTLYLNGLSPLVNSLLLRLSKCPRRVLSTP